VATLFTSQVVEAARDLIRAGTYSFTPAIVQEGTLKSYAENADLAEDLPAVLITAFRVLPSFFDITAEVVRTDVTLRIFLVNSWGDGDRPYVRAMDETEELAERFIRTSGQPLDMGASIPGYTIEKATLTEILLDPIEMEIVTQGMTRRIFATAFEVQVRGRAAR